MSYSVPLEMDAVELTEEGGPLTLQRRPVARPAAGEVLARVAAAPINPSDLGFLAGTYTVKRTLPVVPGFEGSGTVVAAGPGLMPRLLGRAARGLRRARGRDVGGVRRGTRPDLHSARARH
jgi:NADPH:quinone reductase-like Zn-dependent oxidoreductase